MTTTDQGNIGEHLVAADLIARGYIVLFPNGGNPHYDLVIEKNGRFLKVDVKYVTQRNGKVLVKLYTQGHRDKMNYHGVEDVDIVAAYDATARQIYYLLRKDFVNNKCAVALRIDKAAIDYPNLLFAKDYTDLRL